MRLPTRGELRRLALLAVGVTLALTFIGMFIIPNFHISNGGGPAITSTVSRYIGYEGTLPEAGPLTDTTIQIGPGNQLNMESVCHGQYGDNYEAWLSPHHYQPPSSWIKCTNDEGATVHSVNLDRVCPSRHAANPRRSTGGTDTGTGRGGTANPDTPSGASRLCRGFRLFWAAMRCYPGAFELIIVII
jgi:hypothetical protein